MKTLNVRLAAVLLACGTVFIVSVHFIHRDQVRRNAYVFLNFADEAQQRAEQAREDDDAKKETKENELAIQNLSWYVNLVSDDIDAAEKLGILQADIGIATSDPRMCSAALLQLEKVVQA